MVASGRVDGMSMGKAKVTIYALRRDGFSGPISLALKEAPSGLRLAPAEIPAGAEKLEATLSVAGRGEVGAFSPRMEGEALVDGTVRRRLVVPADDRMQAFFYRHLVPAQEWVVVLRGREK